MDLLAANLVYVAYRLVVTAHVVKFFNRYVNYYAAVLLAAQVSFAYDFGLFGWLLEAEQTPAMLDLILTNVTYTLRVLAAWWLIRQIWNRVGNYYLAVFIGAQITFVADYFIFNQVY